MSSFSSARICARLGRFHQHRHAHLSGPFRFLEAAAAPRVLISAEAVPYRPHRGVYVIVDEPRDRTGLDRYLQWCHGEHHPALLASPGVVGVWTFASTPAWAREFDTGDRRVTVCWLDDDPLVAATAIDALEAARREQFDDVMHATFAGPLETITPGAWDWFERTS